MTAQEHLNKLKAKADERISNGEAFRKATMPENVYGWSVAEHQAMQKLAQHYRTQGCSVTSRNNHGVTDWEITPELVVE